MSNPADVPLDELLARMRWVRRLARALVKDADQADDLAQEAWRFALEQPPTAGSSWRGWFAQVMKNRVKDARISRDLRAPLEAKLPLPDSPATPADILLRLETQQVLGEAVKALAEPYRTTILLRYFEDWSIRQIAVREGVQSRAIESRLRRGRDLIRLQLEKRGPVKTWATGLLLLSQPPLAPGMALRVLPAGLLALVAGLLAWMVWPAPRDQGAGANARPGSGSQAAAPSESSSIPLPFSRDEVAAAPPEFVAEYLRFSVIDAGNERPLAGVRVKGEFIDAESRVLSAVEWVSSSEAPYQAPIPHGARQVRLVTEQSEAHAGVPFGGLYSWENESVNPIVRIRSERLRGEILGRVMDLDGLPVPGAEVGVWLQSQERTGGAPERRIPVAPDGTFSMPLAVAQQAELFLAPMAPGHCALRHFRLTKERPDNAYVDNLELLLAPARAVSVKVQDEAGAPIAGAEVVIWPSEPSDGIPVFPLGQYEGRLQHRLRTGATGVTPDLLLDRDLYSLAVRRAGYTQQSLELPADESSVTLTLPPAMMLSGQVRTEQGSPAPGVRVIVEGVGQEECQTDGNGRFTVACPSGPAEEVRLILLPPAPHAVQILGPFRPQEHGEPLDCRLERSPRLAARLIGTDGQLYEADPKLRVEVRGGPQSRQPNGDAHSTESWAQLLPQPRPNPFRQSSAAELELDGLPAGSYLVSFFGGSGLVAEAWVAAGAPRADIVIGSYPEARATLAGCLRMAPDGAPVSQFHVRCQRLGSNDAQDLLQEQFSLDCEAEDGRFLLQGIPPGWWQVQIEESDRHSAWGVAALQLLPDSRTELEPMLEATFEGRLTILGSEGQPAMGNWIRLVDNKNQALIFGLPAHFQAQLDQQGSIFLQRLPRRSALAVEVRAPGSPEWRMAVGSLDPVRTSWQLSLSR